MSESPHASDAADLARRIRVRCLKMVHAAKCSHIGSCLSAADVLGNLYAWWLRIDPDRPQWRERDRFILSKGHAAAALYSVLALKGFFPTDWLASYSGDGTKLGGHATHKGIPGVEVSTGALGHGLPLAVGMAIGLNRDGLRSRVAVLMGDGECQEGSVWEAAWFAARHRLTNLVAVVDHNRIQAFGRLTDVMGDISLARRWEGFGWRVLDIDGHDHDQIASALATASSEGDRPTVIIARTVKGKGVSFMEDDLLWHYKPPDDNQLAAALAEIEADRALPRA